MYTFVTILATKVLARTSSHPIYMNMDAQFYFSFIDLTSLNTTDSKQSITKFINKVNLFSNHFPHHLNVAAVCVSPIYVSLVRNLLPASKEVKLATVAAGFPMSQTSLAIKIAECVECVNLGADELDIVIAVGEMLEGNYQAVSNELAAIRAAVPNTHLKVILETGALRSLDNIKKAAELAIGAGADFIKTSTGKLEPAATPDAFACMAQVVKQHFTETNKMVGLKAAGGIVNYNDAKVYTDIIEQCLGEQWLTPTYYRLGASRLANNLLGSTYF